MSSLARVKRTYAAGARGAGRLLSRAGVLQELVPPHEHRVRHWAYSLARVHDSLGLIELGVPWWTYGAIEAVEAWLAAHPRPIRAFEYGAGASTLWLAHRVDALCSIEHDVRFAALLQPLIATAGNVDLRTVAPVPAAYPTTSSAKEGHAGLDFSAYVGAIDDVGGHFDLVVVDGRARAACVAQALPRLAPDGLLVLDNSRRRRYRAAVAGAVAAGFTERRMSGLTPTLPYPEQTSLLTRERA